MEFAMAMIMIMIQIIIGIRMTSSKPVEGKSLATSNIQRVISNKVSYIRGSLTYTKIMFYLTTVQLP